jgi:hypothetical protein
MAEIEKNRFTNALLDIYKSVSEYHHKKEQDDFDFSARSYEWNPRDKDRWSCQFQQAEGRICLNESYFCWHACVKRPDFVGKSVYLQEFQQAVEWIEKELVDLANQPQPPVPPSRSHSRGQVETDRARLKQKYLDGPYWIPPAALEPERPTYHVFIELEAEPNSFETIESICGDTLRIKERYLTPSKQAAAIDLDFDHFNIDQPLGDNSDWYRFTSLTSFYQQTSVVEQAQNIWNQSKILQQFKDGKIIRARYGYKEGETGFVEYLGACERTDQPWGPPESRQEYLEEFALRHTICYALAVNDFRDYLGLSQEAFSDEKLLVTMHKDRAMSKYIPAEVKRESKLWLAQEETVY